MITARVDLKKFNESLRAYRANSKRTAVEIVNTKMYYIARKAIANTQKADQQKIKAELEAADVTNVVFTKTGKLSKNKKNRSKVFGGSKYNTQENSRLAKIINARRLKEGKKALHGDELLAESRRVFAARMRSVGFIKSGFLPAEILYFALASEKRGLPPKDRTAKVIGQPKGGGRPAHSGQGDFLKAEMWNNALEAKHATNKSGAMAVAVNGLQKAFNDEARSMDGYVKSKLAKANAKFNAANK